LRPFSAQRPEGEKKKKPKKKKRRGKERPQYHGLDADGPSPPDLDFGLAQEREKEGLFEGNTAYNGRRSRRAAESPPFCRTLEKNGKGEKEKRGK